MKQIILKFSINTKNMINNMINSMDEKFQNISYSIKRLQQYMPNLTELPINEPIDKYFDNVIDMILATFINYEKSLQQIQNNLRKHIKNEIELKIYYEHLESVISELKIQMQSKQTKIDQLYRQLEGCKQKERYYLTLTNNNTKNNEQISTKLDTKVDTLTKIKHRLSLNNTDSFYHKKIQKDHDTYDLHSKRQNLANTLRNLYEQQKIKQKSKSNDKNHNKHKKSSKSRQKTSKQKPKLKQGHVNDNLRNSRKKIGSKSIKSKGGKSGSSSLLSSRKNSIH